MLTDRDKRDHARAMAKREETCDKIEYRRSILLSIFDDRSANIDENVLRQVCNEVADLKILLGSLKTECEYLINLEEHEPTKHAHQDWLDRMLLSTSQLIQQGDTFIERWSNVLKTPPLFDTPSSRQNDTLSTGRLGPNVTSLATLVYGDSE